MATSNFAFEVKDILGLESTHLESQVAKIGLNGPMNNRAKVKNIFWVYHTFSIWSVPIGSKIKTGSKFRFPLS